MNNPELYHKCNLVQRRDSEHIIKEFAKIIQWRYDGQDSLIDVGSGPGDVLMDFIYPLMPTNFRRVVFSDINPTMVNYAKSQYGHVENSEFKVLEISSEKELPKELKGQFDHVVSFYTMMWVPNQRQALKNIYQLLRPSGGDCLVVFVAYHPMYDGITYLSQEQKWLKYMTDVDKVIPPLQYSKKPAKEYGDMMSQAGFTSYKIEVQNNTFEYENLEVAKANIKAVNPFLDRMPPHLHDDYINELISMIANITDLPTNIINTPEAKYPVSYKLIVAYARKFPEISA